MVVTRLLQLSDFGFTYSLDLSVSGMTTKYDSTVLESVHPSILHATVTSELERQ